MIRALASKVLNKARVLLGHTPSKPSAGKKRSAVAQHREEDPRLKKVLDQALVWGTREQTELMGAEPSTVAWGHNWVIHQLSRLFLLDKVLVDLGSGFNNPVIVFYGRRVRHAYLVDVLNPGKPFDRATVLQSDLEEPLPLPDSSVDLVVSTSVLEHLTEAGRLRQMREIERVLRPGGRAFVTMSFFFKLDDHALDVLGREPWLIEHGNTIKSRIDVAAMIEAAPGLRLLGHSASAIFPGFDGFDEEKVLAIPTLLTQVIADAEWGTFTPETNALGIRWAELGIALEKPAEDTAVGSAAARREAGAATQACDARVERVLAACPSVAGKRILVLYDDDSAFSRTLEEAGATVHSCVADMETYTAVKARFPARPCWVHDLERPWSLKLDERYDLVVAFDLLHRLSDPAPLLSYVTQLAPRVLIDTVVVDSDKSEVAASSTSDTEERALRCAPSVVWIADMLGGLDVTVRDLSTSVPDTPESVYGWQAGNSGTYRRDGRLLRRLLLCERKRDELSPIIVHVHLPKTGGQSVNHYLSTILGDRMALFYGNKPSMGRWDVFGERMNETPEPMAFSAHAVQLHFPRILGGRLALYMTFLRHPYDTLFSYTKYIKKSYDILPPVLKNILPPNCKEMRVPDIMEWYLTHSHPAHYPGHILPVHHLTQCNDIERAKEIVGRFLFVGITEEMGRSMAVLRKKLEPYGFYLPELEWERKNTTAGLELNGYNVHSDRAFIKHFKENLADELAFYEWARARFEREAQRFGV